MTDGSPFPPVGTDFGSAQFDVSTSANDRYWAGAGIEHEARAEGLLYPPMAVNLTILLVQRTVQEGFLHTWGSLRWLRPAPAGSTLTVSGRVVERFEKRERDYFTIESEVADADGAVFTGLTELASSRRRPGATDTDAPERPTYDEPGPDAPARRLALTSDLLRTYSRAGNFHSDDAAAQAMGLPGMVAMGMQTVGPVLGLLLERRGVDALDRGSLETRFMGLVLEDDTVEAVVDPRGDDAPFAVRNVTKNLTTAAGTVVLGA